MTSKKDIDALWSAIDELRRDRKADTQRVREARNETRAVRKALVAKGTITDDDVDKPDRVRDIRAAPLAGEFDDGA